MYKTFHVKNFRCFKDLQINDLGRVNLIAGKNNTGKTALMEAMHVLAGSYDGRILLRDHSLRWVYLNQAAPSDSRNQLSWETLFRNLDITDAIEISATASKIEARYGKTEGEIEVKIEKVSSDRFDYESILNGLGYRYEVLPDDIEVLALNSSLEERTWYLALTQGGIVKARRTHSRYCYSQFLHSRKFESVRDTERRFGRIQQAKEIPVLVDTLKVIEDRIEDVRIDRDSARSFLVVDLGLRSMIPMSVSGEGMSRLSDFILAMFEAQGGLIFIDEIENGIHHSVQCKVWQAIGKVARDLDIQVFATTHSLEMIRAAYEAFEECGALDDLRLHRLDRDAETGEIEAVTYNRRGLEALATFDFDFEVRG